MPHIDAGSSDRARQTLAPGLTGRPCAACPTVCAEACFNDAVRRVGAAINVDAGLCAGCGACVGSCRHGLIVLVAGVARFRPESLHCQHDGATDA